MTEAMLFAAIANKLTGMKEAASVGGLFHFKTKTTSTRQQRQNWRSQLLATSR